MIARAALNQKVQKSIWLTIHTWRAYEKAARKRSGSIGERVTSGELMRQALNEWIEENK